MLDNSFPLLHLKNNYLTFKTNHHAGLSYTGNGFTYIFRFFIANQFFKKIGADIGAQQRL